MNSLRAGASQTIITPPVGVDLCGFGGRAGPSQGVHDDLWAKALYLAEGTGEVLLITADLIGLSAEEVATVRDLIYAELGLPADAVMVTCSHTHSGPATRCIKYLGDWNDAYLGILVRKIASVGIMAAKHAEPAELGWMREPASIHVNRRQRTPEGLKLGVNPDGVTLPWVDVLTVQSASGKPLARWFCHAAHAVTLGGDNLLISADWPGYAQRAVEGAEPGALALFAQGCCGNLNSHPRGSFEIAEQQGWVIAGAVLKAAALAHLGADQVLDHASQTLALPLQDPPPVEEARAMLEGHRRALAQVGDDTPYQTRKMLAGYVQWAEHIVALAEREAPGLSVPFEVHVVRVGDTALVGLPGEVFAEYALRIAERSPAAQTVVTGYTNGNFGYVPPEEAFAQGGYEIDSAFRFYTPTRFQPQCEQLILDAAEGLLRSLFA